MNVNELSEIVKSNKKVIVKFEADWCQPCKELTIVLDNVASKIKEVFKIVHVDIAESPELVELFSIKSIPCVVKYENGEVSDKFIGTRDDDFLYNFITSKGKMSSESSQKKFF
jgi:thioredoxin 1